MIKDEPWLILAKNLKYGASQKMQCCKKDNSMSVKHGNKGYMAHCFRCGASRFEPHGELSIAAIARRKVEKEYASIKEVRLPYDYDSCIPESYGYWFLRVGISYNTAMRNKWGYSKSLDRIIMPVYENKELVSVQARSLKNQPKYLNIGKSEGVLYTPADDPNTPYVIVTEDILSATKVNRVVSAVSTIGTNFSDTHAVKLAALNKTVILWYDADKAGKAGVKIAEVKLGFLGVDTKVIRTKNDPKFATTKMIKQRIEQCLIKT